MEKTKLIEVSFDDFKEMMSLPKHSVKKVGWLRKNNKSMVKQKIADLNYQEHFSITKIGTTPYLIKLSKANWEK